jgi:hypothetical protein
MRRLIARPSCGRLTTTPACSERKRNGTWMSGSILPGVDLALRPCPFEHAGVHGSELSGVQRCVEPGGRERTYVRLVDRIPGMVKFVLAIERFRW